MADREKELLDALESHKLALARIGDQRERLLAARAATLKELYLDHGKSYQTLGDIVGMTATGMMGLLRKAGIEQGSSKTKPGPKQD